LFWSWFCSRQDLGGGNPVGCRRLLSARPKKDPEIPPDVAGLGVSLCVRKRFVPPSRTTTLKVGKGARPRITPVRDDAGRGLGRSWGTTESWLFFWSSLASLSESKDIVVRGR
jgi:hypothetical protein